MNVQKLSRREFLQLGGLTGSLLVLGVHVGCTRESSSGRGGTFAPNVFVAFQADGTVLITASRTEMGQGVRTALPRVVADELEADWSRVRVVQGTGDEKYGHQNTDGSMSVRLLYGPCRQAGAAAREMLVQAAAAIWGVDAASCRARNHAVEHPDSDRRLDYADLLERAAALPVPESAPLKPADEFRLIGQSVRSVDLEDIVRGDAIYGIDAELPQMKYACIARCPVLGGALKGYDDRAARAVPGVRSVHHVRPTPWPALFYPKEGVAVVADSSWAAMRGRDALEVEWEDGPNGGYDSASYRRRLAETVLRPGAAALARGDVDAAFSVGGKLVEALYQTPMLAHASLEPPAALAAVDDERCEVWAPAQDAQDTRKLIAEWLERPIETVTVHVPLAGGAFGRKSKPDFVLEAVELSRQSGAPVKVLWTREDDLRHDYLHAEAAQYMKAVLGDDGLPRGWLMRAAYPTIDWLWDPELRAPMQWELGMGLTNMPYDVPNLRIEGGEAEVPIRIGWLRSVCNVWHGFALNSFVDELAAAAGRDPLEYRLALLGPDRIFAAPNEPEDSFNGLEVDTSRARGVLERVAERSGWGNALPDGRYRGIAVHNSFYSYVATIIEIAMRGERDFRVERVTTAVDCGTVINPDGVRAQVEGATIFGLSLALYGEVTAKAGRIEQSNYNDYRILRIDEAPPAIDVHTVASTAAPTGIGEPATPLIAPALAGALYAATGRRIRELPIARALAADAG